MFKNKIKDRQTDWPRDRRWSEKLIWNFSSGELKLTRIYFLSVFTCIVYTQFTHVYSRQSCITYMYLLRKIKWLIILFLSFSSAVRQTATSCSDIHEDGCRDLLSTDPNICDTTCAKTLCPVTCGGCSKSHRKYFCTNYHVYRKWKDSIYYTDR